MNEWEMYAADFDAMTDEEVEYEYQLCLDQINEAESWTDAVCAWRAAGSPRKGDA